MPTVNAPLRSSSLAEADGADAGFAAVLRARTAAIHREAERGGFVADLIRGRASRHGYALYLRNLGPVYDALEAALDEGPDEVPAPFAEAGLRRRAALHADLAVIAGDGWAALPILPEAEAYARAVAAAAENACLLAHAYARYLGDLSGGQILKPVLARTLGLGPDALAFYDFPQLQSVALHKERMRQSLDEITGADGDAIAEEAISAFRHNIAVSHAVQVAAG